MQSFVKGALDFHGEKNKTNNNNRVLCTFGAWPPNNETNNNNRLPSHLPCLAS
uniref:Uncharacterized protein n=1 Tax=Anguilla anguilla TaxID=7936 RepID=A0A0E9RZU7_ANGAN